MAIDNTSDSITRDEFLDGAGELIWHKIDEKVRGFVRSFGTSNNVKLEDLNDISQDVLVKLYSKQAVLLSEKSGEKFIGFLYTITKHVYYDFYNKNKRKRTQPIGKFDVPEALEEKNENIAYLKFLKPFVDNYSKAYILNKKMKIEDKVLVLRCFRGCAVESLCDHEPEGQITRNQKLVGDQRRLCAKKFIEKHADLIDKNNPNNFKIVLGLLGQKRFYNP